MTSKEIQSDDIAAAPINIDNSSRKTSIDSVVENGRKKKKSGKSILKFLYNPKKQTVLGRGSLNWGK
jgi:hypothetical protein